MTVNKRQKDSRMRGTHTHGWGAKKKHRGAGHRGGRGRAGTGKRGDAKKPSVWADKHYFGKRGFLRYGQKKDIKTVNINHIEENIGAMMEDNLISREGDTFSIDLEKIGFNKLLGSGKVSKKMNIKAPYASSKAIEKIKSAGGDVIGLISEVQKKGIKEKPE